MANLPPSDGKMKSGIASVTAKMGTQSVRPSQSSAQPDYGTALLYDAKERGERDSGMRKRENQI